jgi:hypothetical protein
MIGKGAILHPMRRSPGAMKLASAARLLQSFEQLRFPEASYWIAITAADRFVLQDLAVTIGQGPSEANKLGVQRSIAMLAYLKPLWLRAPASWVLPTGRDDELRDSLAAHLFCRHEAPGFLSGDWL